MNGNELSQNVALLLQHGTEIIKKYDKLYQQKGLKYNIFKVACINDKEVIMCKIIADLLNPKGKHYKGDLYLKLFWDTVSPKIGDGQKLNTKDARVITEYNTDVDRRIDIVIEDGKIFVPVEVKIRASEQPNQIKDYAAYSRVKNGNTRIPVLYLTLWGRESKTADSGNYVCISFGEDILAWLNQCLIQPETESTPPVREILKQLIGAVKSICDYTEDEEMGKEISELITQSEENIRAALAINANLDEIDDEIYTYFSKAILECVQKELPETELSEDDEGGWWSILVPIKNGKYEFYTDYYWQKIGIWPISGKTSNSPEEKKLAKKMSEILGVDNEKWDNVVWVTEQARCPGLENTDEDLYPYKLYKQYAEHSAEIVGRIVHIVRELEKV
jgi:hypothetical protein